MKKTLLPLCFTVLLSLTACTSQDAPIPNEDQPITKNPQAEGEASWYTTLEIEPVNIEENGDTELPSSTKINVAWQHTSMIMEEYRIVATEASGESSVSASIDGGQTSLELTGLKAGTTYEIQGFGCPDAQCENPLFTELFSYTTLEETQEPEIDPDQETSAPQTTYQLVSTGGGASCFAYEIQDQNGNRIESNDEIENILQCIYRPFTFSPDNNFLVYKYKNEKTKYYDLKLFNFQTESVTTLMSFNSTMDGLDCVWEENSLGLACLAINQRDYPSSTKIFYLSINDSGELQEKKRFVQNSSNVAYFTCGSVCFPHDFWFDGDYIVYPIHEEIAPGETFSIKYK